MLKATLSDGSERCMRHNSCTAYPSRAEGLQHCKGMHEKKPSTWRPFACCIHIAWLIVCVHSLFSLTYCIWSILPATAGSTTGGTPEGLLCSVALSASAAVAPTTAAAGRSTVSVTATTAALAATPTSASTTSWPA